MTPGAELSRAFWENCVRPALGSDGDRVGAALIGPGSEVLGFDDEVSADHDYGPRLKVVIPRGVTIDDLQQRLDEALPETFSGLPVRYATTADPLVRHRVEVNTVETTFIEMCGIDPTAAITNDSWLATPTQLLASVTAGAVFADPAGELEAARAALARYPDPVWRYVLACQWRRVSQEEPFLARAATVGDELGSRVIAARLARDLIRLAFLVERQWAPYTKWLGTAFAHLDLADDITLALETLTAADGGPEREAAYLTAVRAAAEATNDLGLTPAIETTPRPFHTRAIQVLGAQRFADALIEPGALAQWGWRGAIDQWVDNTDALAKR